MIGRGGGRRHVSLTFGRKSQGAARGSKKKKNEKKRKEKEKNQPQKLSISAGPRRRRGKGEAGEKARLRVSGCFTEMLSQAPLGKINNKKKWN